jgi:hypothetical protein
MSDGATYWITVVCFGVIVLTVIVAVWDGLFGPSDRTTRRRKAPIGPLQDEYRERRQVTDENVRRLLNACSGDQGLAERLIQYEWSRLPHLSFGDAVKSALERLLSDRR